MRILMVCLGNICRSPLAEGIMTKKVVEKKLDWQIDSAGTSGWHVGERPDPRSVRVAQQHGLNIRQQKSRQFIQQDFQDFDLIFAMDNSNFQNIVAMANTPDQEEKVQLVLKMAHGHNTEVPDPYYMDDGFEGVYQMLDEACDLILDKLTKK